MGGRVLIRVRRRFNCMHEAPTVCAVEAHPQASASLSLKTIVCKRFPYVIRRSLLCEGFYPGPCLCKAYAGERISPPPAHTGMTEQDLVLVLIRRSLPQAWFTDLR